MSAQLYHTVNISASSHFLGFEQYAAVQHHLILPIHFH